MVKKKHLATGQPVFITKNISHIRTFILGGNAFGIDFSPSLDRVLTVKNYEGSCDNGFLNEDLYRLSGGVVNMKDGVCVSITEFLIPISAILDNVIGEAPKTPIPNRK